MRIVFIRQYGVARKGLVVVLSEKFSERLISQHYALRLLN